MTEVKERRGNKWKLKQNIKLLSSSTFDFNNKCSWNEWLRMRKIVNIDHKLKCACQNRSMHTLNIYFNQTTGYTINLGSTCENHFKMIENCKYIDMQNIQKIHNNPAVYCEILNVYKYSDECEENMLKLFNYDIKKNNSNKKLTQLLDTLSIIYGKTRKECWKELIDMVSIKIKKQEEIEQRRELERLAIERESKKREALRELERLAIERESKKREALRELERLAIEKAKQLKIDIKNKKHADKLTEFKKLSIAHGNSPPFCKKFCKCENPLEYKTIRLESCIYTLQCPQCNKITSTKCIKKTHPNKKSNLIRISNNMMITKEFN